MKHILCDMTQETGKKREPQKMSVGEIKSTIMNDYLFFFCLFIAEVDLLWLYLYYKKKTLTVSYSRVEIKQSIFQSYLNIME